MSFTILNFLEENHCALKDSIYADCDPSMLNFKIYSGDFYQLEQKDGKRILRFKNAVDLMGFENLTQILPDLDKLKLPDRELFPYCTDRLEMFAAALAEDRDSTAVEGGPCLFSEHEVIAEVTSLSGEIMLFDYSEGKAYKGAKIDAGPEAAKKQSTESFAAYVRAHIREISDIRFHCYKTGLSPQEYLHLRMPFETAAVLGIRLVVSLPDMSYRKYLMAALEEAEPAFRDRVIREFDEILYDVTDKYLDLIRRLQEIFRVRDLKVLHGRDQELLQKFYDGRRPFIERSRILKNLTRISEKIEPVKDYVSLPAAPYYLSGATRILEVNSVVETDSFRKCKKAHKGTLDFACILFPELLSSDGAHTMYYAPPEFKEYGSYPLDL